MFDQDNWDAEIKQAHMEAGEGDEERLDKGRREMEEARQKPSYKEIERRGRAEIKKAMALEPDAGVLVQFRAWCDERNLDAYAIVTWISTHMTEAFTKSKSATVAQIIKDGANTELITRSIQIFMAAYSFGSDGAEKESIMDFLLENRKEG